MKLHKTIKRFEQDDSQTLSQGARDIGHELPRNRLGVLVQFRAMLAGLPRSKQDYANGYRDAVRDILAAYGAAVECNVRHTVDEMFAQYCSTCSNRINSHQDETGGYRFCSDGCPQSCAWTSSPVYSHYNPPPGYGVCTRDPEHDGPCAHPLLNGQAQTKTP